MPEPSPPPDRPVRPLTRPAERDPRLDSDELRYLIDQAHADVRRTESVGPALVCGTVLACLPILLVLVGLLLW